MVKSASKRSRGAGRPPAGRPKKRARTTTSSGRRGSMKMGTTVLRTKYAASQTFSTASTGGFWNYWSVAIGNGTYGFNNFAEFANVFEQYKVHWIKYEFRPKYDNLAAGVVGVGMSQSMPYAVVCKDPESTLVPSGTYTAANLNTLLEHQGSFVRPLNKKLTVVYRPGVQIPTNIGSGVMYKYSPWLSTQDTSVPLRGYHMFLVNNGFASSAPDLELDIYITYKVSFRNFK